MTPLRASHARYAQLCTHNFTRIMHFYVHNFKWKIVREKDWECVYLWIQILPSDLIFSTNWDICRPKLQGEFYVESFLLEKKERKIISLECQYNMHFSPLMFLSHQALNIYFCITFCLDLMFNILKVRNLCVGG